jgi:hypothetical protein
LLGLENGIARARALLHSVVVGAKLLEVGDHEERIAALESALAARPRDAELEAFPELG